jgi:hypothetical protein
MLCVHVEGSLGPCMEHRYVQLYVVLCYVCMWRVHWDPVWNTGACSFMLCYVMCACGGFIGTLYGRQVSARGRPGAVSTT